MLFGNKESFAVEAMSEPALMPPSAVWGRMRVWCGNASIGDFSEEFCALYGSYVGFKALNARLPHLWRDEFEGLSDMELWNFLDERLYGFHGDVPVDDRRSLEECQRDAGVYGIFDLLTNWGEQFDDGGKSFIVCPSTHQAKILNRSWSHGISLEVPILPITLAVSGYLAWFEEESSRLGFPVT